MTKKRSKGFANSDSIRKTKFSEDKKFDYKLRDRWGTGSGWGVGGGALVGAGRRGFKKEGIKNGINISSLKINLLLLLVVVVVELFGCTNVSVNVHLYNVV